MVSRPQPHQDVRAEVLLIGEGFEPGDGGNLVVSQCATVFGAESLMPTSISGLEKDHPEITVHLTWPFY